MSFLLLWLGVMFPLVFSPGPANIVFAASGAKVGVKRSLPLLCGVDLVFIIKSMIIGFGFGHFLEKYPLFLQLLQLAGSVYLTFLAIGFLKSSLVKKERDYKLLGFKDGIIIQLLNAKGWVMLVLMFSLFTDPAQAMYGDKGIISLVVLLAILNIGVHLVWIWGGGLINKFSLVKNNHKAQNLFYACSLIIVAVWLVFDNSIWKI